MTKSRLSLIEGFVRSATRFPERPALEVAGAVLTYRDLAGRAGALAGLIDQAGDDQPLAGVFAYRSTDAYAGMIAVLLAGKGYVPLNPHYPTDRNQYVVARSGIRTMIVSDECVEALIAMLPGIDQALTIILAGTPKVSELAKQFPNHRFIDAAFIPQDHVRANEVRDTKRDALAYVIFTSGSTGQPKGVAIRQTSVIDYARYLTARYGMTENDRIAQFSDITFDFSVHDIWTCWECGGALCIVPKEMMIAPAKFIREQRITCWASVPSVAGMLSKLRMLRRGAFPDLRVTVFCGEPLPVALAQQWQAASPDGIVENIYGPTEATVAITHFRWETGASEARSTKGIVPIGWAFEGQHTAVVIDDEPAPRGTVGELLLGGSQVAAGYWNDPDRTRDRFVVLPALGDTRWYRTGDLAWEDPDGCLHFGGRIDNQVKVRGFRVELQDVEFAVRSGAGTEHVACVAWPIRDGSADGIVAFLGERGASDADILRYCREHLPDYMVPRMVLTLEDGLPLSPNGKVDRRALEQVLESRIA